MIVKSNGRWQDEVLLVIGVWLFFAPFLMGYASTSAAAAWNACLVGIGISFFAARAIGSPSEKRLEGWVNLLLGAWLVAAPFALRFYISEPLAAWTQIVLGLAVAADSDWILGTHPAAGRHEAA